MGRPREFDEDAAIEAALRVFWERGYHDTSVAELTRATRLHKGSLYGAFTDKQTLFLRALDRYVEERRRASAEFLKRPGSPLAALRLFLHEVARSSAGTSGQLGCLVSNTTLELLPRDSEVAQRIRRNFREMDSDFAALIARAKQAGEVRADVDERIAAQLIVTAMQGLRVRGKASQSMAQAVAVVDLLLDGLT
jgi:TetR/AcrR family transcriptional regulator, transcriptional repressor for nem operon